MNAKVVVCFALPTESKAFLSRGRIVKSLTAGPLPAVSWKPRDLPEVIVVHVGIGRAQAKHTIADWVARVRPLFLLSGGYCGALVGDVGIGSVVLANQISDRALVERILGAVPSAIPGGMVTVDHVVDDAAERARLAAHHSAIAVDMETAGIAEACRRHGTPVVSLRVVTDTPKHPIPIPLEVAFNLTKQRMLVLDVADYLMAHPMRVLPTIRFAMSLGNCGRRLADALIAALTELHREPVGPHPGRAG